MARHLKVVLILIILIFSWSNISAAETIEGGAVIYFNPGMHMMRTGQLSTYLLDNHLPELDTFYLSLGGGGHMMAHRLILGGEGHRIVAREIYEDGYLASLQATYGLFNTGYVALAPGNFRIYPLVGIGGGRMNLEITNTEEDENNNELPMSTENHGILFNFALGTDYLINLSGEEMDKTVMLLGIRLGYILAPFTSRWEGHPHMPEAGIDGFYFRINIGAGAVGNY